MNKSDLFEWRNGEPFYRGLRVRHETIDLAGRRFQIARLEDAAALLDEADFGKRFLEEDIAPYGLELWPSALMLAEFVLRGRAGEKGRALELGCGLALVSTAATRQGWTMTASDNDAISLAFAKHNASLNGVAMHEWTLLDWHNPPQGLLYPRIFGADILYQLVDHGPIVRCIETLLEPGGRAFVADPCRGVADRFPSLAGDHGFTVQIHPMATTGADGQAVQGRIFELHKSHV